ncbi:MAG: 4Fe-4S dicluster domain-containing protein [Candidatus Euphemobacter frigidus]|nr:4Fe-4S dicluster domain-containing protein [Candidatus Euphemobacter frigidus]
MIRTVFRYLFGKTACQMYPKKPAVFFDTTRGHIEIDASRCILCGLCAMNCPVGAITVNREKHYWQIDHLGCIVCGACVEKCPKKCLTMENTYTAPANSKKVKKVNVTPPPKPKKPAPPPPVSDQG